MIYEALGILYSSIVLNFVVKLKNIEKNKNHAKRNFDSM